MKPVTRLAVAVVVSMLGAEHTAAQQPACITIVAGETAVQAEKRLTGDGRNRLAPWFEIVDPQGQRVLSKEEHDHIEPGWRACTWTSVAGSGLLVPISGSRSPVPGSRPHAPASVPTIFADMLSVLAGHELAWLAWAALAAAGILIWLGLDEYLAEREATVAAMKRFGQTFVREFERPLIQPDRAERPIQSQLRASPDRGRLEIFLAPGSRSRYPNLSDHRKNVVYDIGRVLDALRDRRFVCQPVYSEGSWVVVPFQFRVSAREAGSK